MPIELTRRDLVKAGVALPFGVAGWSIQAQWLVGAEPVKRWHNRVVILSDTHIAADPETLSRSGVNMAQQLMRVLTELAEMGRPGDWVPPDTSAVAFAWSHFDFMILNGDNAYDTGEWQDYATLLHDCGLVNFAQVHDGAAYLTLGNHDHRENFRKVAAQMMEVPASQVADKNVVCVSDQYCDWLLLDSLRVVDETPGALGVEQLVWLDAVLGEREAPSPGPSRGEGSEQTLGGRPAIIVVHHPPVPDENPEKPFALQDHAAFWDVVAKHPNVKAVLHGHTHRWHPRPRKWVQDNTGCEHEVVLIGLPPTSYVFEEANPWGYVVADVDAAGVTFTLRAMDGHAADGERVRVAFG